MPWRISAAARRSALNKVPSDRQPRSGFVPGLLPYREKGRRWSGVLNFADFFTAKVSRLIRQEAGTRMSDKEFLEKEIARWKSMQRW